MTPFAFLLTFLLPIVFPGANQLPLTKLNKMFAYKDTVGGGGVQRG